MFTFDFKENHHQLFVYIYSTIDREDEEEKEDFYETHCHWVGCDKGDFGTQEQLVRVRNIKIPYIKTNQSIFASIDFLFLN